MRINNNFRSNNAKNLAFVVDFCASHVRSSHPFFAFVRVRKEEAMQAAL